VIDRLLSLAAQGAVRAGLETVAHPPRCRPEPATKCQPKEEPDLGGGGWRNPDLSGTSKLCGSKEEGAVCRGRGLYPVCCPLPNELVGHAWVEHDG
jgi:hypothetical protein